MARFRQQKKYTNLKNRPAISSDELLAIFQNNHSIFVNHVQEERLPDFLKEYRKAPLAQIGELVFCEHSSNYLWPINSWGPIQLVEIESITKAAKFLKSLQRNWVHQALFSVRRGELISQELPKISAKPIKFPDVAPDAALGVFSLIDNEHLIYSLKSRSPFVQAYPRFAQELEGAPSQAYLKLWEALTRLGLWPTKEEVSLDVGSAPGSWTLALSEISKKVFSIDKAPLDPLVLKRTNVEFIKGDAFKLSEGLIKELDWLFSDVICAPERLYELIESVLKINPKIKMLCTLKFLGPWEPSSVEKFLKIPGSKIQHLYYNKHELCFSRLP